MRFTDTMGRWQAVRSDAPFPVAGGQVLHWLLDDFNGALDTGKWEVIAGSAVPANGELSVSSGTVLLSRQSFQPPCLVEAVITMTARASSDNFRMGFYQSDNNLVEWHATGTSSSNMDTRLSAGGVASDQTAINVGAANNTYRLASIYVGLGEAIWSYRSINALTVRNEAYRIAESGIPDGPFRVRLAGLAGSSQMRVHRVAAYQLADIIPPGALGHHVDGMAIPVRLTNSPFIASPSSPTLGILQAATDTFSSAAAGSVNTGATRNFNTEQCHIQAHFMGDQPFSAWVEAQVDGSNWQVVWYGTSTDATTDAVVRYYAVSPILQLMGSRSVRVKVRNTGTSAGTFRGTLVATQL
ncbi:MAG: hypothetical protein RMM08_04760 [Armatimonadota bacterium]|nr:hypothetical protein [bacterium]MDW8320653.1 hypothetical protein [Armatimonadota bacterium]